MKKYFTKLRLLLASPIERAEILKKSGIQMGENCEVYKNVTFGSEPYLITIGNNVRITANVSFVNHDGGMWVLRKLYNQPNIDFFGKIDIGDNVHIGINSIIMPNVKIGNNVIIGAGSIVTKNVESNSIYAGVPAKKIRSLSDYYDKYKNDFFYTKNMPVDKKKQLLINHFATMEEENVH